jgi:hypothetical protein
MFAALFAALLLAVSVNAAPISALAGRAVDTVSLSNDVGRAYDVQRIYLDSTAGSNVVTVSVINYQDTDTTGTNETIAAVTYTDGTVLSTTSSAVYTPSAILRVPAGGLLRLAYSGTNDYLVIRNEAE